MSDEINVSKLKNKNMEKNISKSFARKFFSRILYSIIFILASLIFINYSENNYLLYKKEVLTKNIPYLKLNRLYEKYFGKVLNSEKKDDTATMVFSSDFLTYEKIEKINNSEKITFNDKTIIKSFMSGIVVFMGEKENLGYTIIVQGVDGTDIWYSNITNSTIKLYDYIEKNTVLGEVNKNLFLTILKDNNYIGYEEYIKQN